MQIDIMNMFFLSNARNVSLFMEVAEEFVTVQLYALITRST